MSNKEHHVHGVSFDHTTPRPPIPGEEKRHYVSDWDGEQAQVEGGKFARPYSPTTKRNSTFQNVSMSASSTAHDGACSSNRVMEKTTETQAGSKSPPSCLRWANSLHALLQDGDGVKLFRQYLHSEGKQHADTLDFWFACEGLRKQQGSDKIMQLVKVIYRQYFVKSALPISDELRREIGELFKSSQCLEPPVTLYDKAQAQIENLIVTTTYPNFLKSDMYLQYLENTQTSSSSDSSDFSNDISNMASALDPLPTVHEDMELIMNPPNYISHASGTMSTGYHTPNIGGPPVRLTKDVLLMSQSRRAVDRSKSETFANMFVYRAGLGVHAAYSSYNPVSRQDSELHSLSSHSDARTESDTMSLTDSSVDGRSAVRRTRRQAALNRESQMNQIVIPRTQRVDKVQCQPMDPMQFAAILTEKLEAVKKQQDAHELLEKKLKDSDTLASINNQNIREKLLLDDENDQSILDDHVSLVFPDTPGRSPGITTPHRTRHSQSSRRRKDGSIFSCDSGNVHDFAEGSEHRMGMVKSKSMPEYQDDRFLRGGVGRRSSSKKAVPDLTDSGVSVVSDSVPSVAMSKDSRVLTWLMSGHNDMSIKQRSSSYRTSSATSPISNRHKKGFGSRSSSVERNSVTGATVSPAQPFVADPSMPPLPIPNTVAQLEEARRRLEDDVRKKSRSSSNRHYPDLTQSSQSTLRKSQRAQRPSLPITQATTAEELTTVVFSFCDEQFPYRTKIPGSQITLKQFKDYLPKKGNYRYFFKTVCEELGNQVIQEEISSDNDIIPLYEGKIMAQVKPID
ncbi:axin isoform X2 [Sitophilus oryzae]|uniref:Axin isoform X2 n=1 Tax=Sitophilus oryzae TaxID=7048 RepID=A0A6J2Y3U0_SITOR|nr:axin isoform X2 [Sitophilus oryzae]